MDLYSHTDIQFCFIESRRGDRGGGFDRGRGRGRGGGRGGGDVNEFRGRRDGPEDFGGKYFIFMCTHTHKGLNIQEGEKHAMYRMN